MSQYRNQTRTLKNAKHEKFALNVVQGMSQAEAYRRAFDNNSKHASSHARRLVQAHPEIALRIANVQRLTAAKVIDTIAISKGYVIDGLKELMERCMQQHEVTDKEGVGIGEWKFDSAGANGALDKMAKILGLYKERAPISLSAEKSDAELLEALDELINSPVGQALKDVGHVVAGEPDVGEAGDGGTSDGAGSSEGTSIPPVPEAG